jgi:hypothetical protein
MIYVPTLPDNRAPQHFIKSYSGSPGGRFKVFNIGALTDT